MVHQGSDRTSFYDGFLYDLLITPQMTGTNRFIKKHIEKGTTALEVGCGIGNLAFALSGTCTEVVGIDFSSKMIRYAENMKKKKGCRNVTFIHGNAAEVSRLLDRKFDYAVMTQFLHETEPEITGTIMEEARRVANRIIISDFTSPLAPGGAGLSVLIQEFLSGKRHYRNFSVWQQRGGLDHFVEKCGLTVLKEVPWKNRCGKLVILSA